MKYINAAEVLPQSLILEIQRHICGEAIYIPTGEERQKWGEKNGSKLYFDNRNKQIKMKYQTGTSIEELAQEFGLAYETVRKVVYKA